MACGGLACDAVVCICLRPFFSFDALHFVGGGPRNAAGRSRRKDSKNGLRASEQVRMTSLALRPFF